jgi:transcriptional regulator with XRE-family HTH domain
MAQHPLRRARLLQELTLEDLAARAEVGYSHICRIERRRIRDPHKFTKRALATALGYAVQDIWPRDGDLPHPELRPPKRTAVKR